MPEKNKKYNKNQIDQKTVNKKKNNPERLRYFLKIKIPQPIDRMMEVIYTKT